MNTSLSIILAALSLLGNAFFVGSEFGLISARRSSIEPRAIAGSRSAKITLQAMEQVSIMLAGAQLGVTLCSLVLGAVAEPLIANGLRPPFHNLGLPHSLAEVLALIIALALMTYLHVVLGEMVPKNLAMAGPERVALVLTPLLSLFVRLTKPIVHGLNALANGVLWCFGIKPQREIASSFTRDEVAGFVEESRREGLLSDDERDLLSGALQLDERRVSSVLLPLNTLITTDTSVTPDDIEHLAIETGFSRFPVLTKASKMIGYIHLKDILAIDQANYSQPVPRRLIRPLARVKLTSSLRSALTTMRELGTHLAVAADAHGQVTGIVTLEDVVEELVGEIRDDNQKIATP